MAAVEEGVVRLVLAHGQRGFIEAVGLRLDIEPDLAVVGVATGGRELVALCEQHRPDLVLLDADDLAPPATPFRWMALVSGLDALRCVYLLRAGAAGVSSKEATAADLVAGVRATHAGGVWVPPDLSPAVLGLLLRADPKPTPEQRAMARLTDREREIVACLVRGVDQQTIAAQLSLSPNTVRTHVRNVLVKLGVHTSLEATALARRAAAAGQDGAR